ncbi:MAG: DUF1361 domain-containing protein [Saprospiraceae bacterium]
MLTLLTNLWKTEPRVRLLVLLGASMAFSVSMGAFRIWHSNTLTYAFLVWNLMLAAIPYGISTLLVEFESLRKRQLLFWSLLALWLLFLPNAPYIFTDLFHLKPRNGVPLWFDLLLLLSFAWNGIILCYLSLFEVQELVAARIGKRLTWLSVFAILFLCAFGVYLGRFLRWNSWDLFLNPSALFSDIADRFLHPLLHLQTWGLTLGYGTFLILGYLTLQMLIRHQRNI